MALFRLPLLLLLLLAPLVYAAASPHDYSPGRAAANRADHHTSTRTATFSIDMAASSSTTERVNLVHEREPSASGAETVGSDYESVAAAPPPHPLPAAWELASPLLPPQAQRQAEGSASATAASPVNDPAAATIALLPLVNPRTSVAPRAAGVVASDGEEGLQRLGRVLTSLEYNEMPSTKAPLARWPGAITVFAAPDFVLQASCPICSRRYLLLEHIAMGYYYYSDLAAIATTTAMVPSASIGFCLKIVADRGPFGIDYRNIFVDGVEVSQPELYNDGRYVVHGLHSLLHPVSQSSCFDGSRRHLTARSVGTSATASASVGRIMIREVIARLRDEGYGFMALAMRVKFAEMERFGNLTVFELDDQAIFVGGGQDYVSIVRFHIVPGHRLIRADLLSLRPGTILPTLASEGWSLVVTHGASSGAEGVRINYVPVKEADVCLNSRVAIDVIYRQFPDLHGWLGDTDDFAGDTAEDDAWTDGAPAVLWAIGLLPGFLIPLGNYCFGRKTFSSYQVIDGRIYHVCDSCKLRAVNWIASCCQLCLCTKCFADVFLRRHSTDLSDVACVAPGAVGELIEDHRIVFAKNRNFYRSSKIEVEAEQVPHKTVDPAAMLKLEVYTKWRDLFARYPPQRILKITVTEHNERKRCWRGVHLVPKAYTSTKIPVVMNWIGWD